MQKYGPAVGEDGPVRFAVELFGVKLDPWQERVLRAYGRGERRISIRACHGPGKTFTASLMIWHSLICRFPQNTVATAPSRAQLEDALFKEVLVLYKKLPEVLQSAFLVKQNRIEFVGAPKESFFSARTARAESPEALQGVHCDEGWVLLIADEASGVDEKIFEAAAGSMSGERATTLLLSNPVRSTGFFYDTHNKLKDIWFTVHVTGVRDGAGEYSPRVTDDFVMDIGRRYGEDSNAYRIRVLGEFPLGDQDTIIPVDYVESAANRDIVLPKNASTIWGVDVARFGDDSNALVKRTKLSVLPDILEWSGVDLMQTAGRVKREWDDTPPHERPDEILVDVIGLGAGVVDRLRELGLPARGINVSEQAAFTDKYRNLRTELWFNARDWLGTKDHALPRCDGKCGRKCGCCKLADELTLLRYAYTSTGKLMAEPKDNLKKRGFKSPNIADAFVLTFASEPATLVHGTKDNWSTNWHEPVKRNRAVV